MRKKNKTVNANVAQDFLSALELISVSDDSEKNIEEKQLRMLVDKLDSIGVPSVFHKTHAGYNKFYLGNNIVFVLIHSDKGVGSADKTDGYTIIDRAAFDRLFNKKADNLSLSLDERHDGKYRVRVYGRLKSGKNTSGGCLHQLIIDCDGNRSIDHICHAPTINMEEYLRAATISENNMNKAYYSKVLADGKSFKVVDKVNDPYERINLSYQGYSFRGKYVFSPKFNTKAEMYTAINEYERKFLNGFQYNPLVDFLKTWYVVVVNGFIGAIDVREYNRSYIILHDPKKAEYYQLA